MVAIWILAVSALVTTIATYLAVSVVFGSSSKQITITVDGEEQLLYVQPTSWSSDIEVEGSEVEMIYNRRAYISTVDKVDPDAYFTVDVLGGMLEFDLDLSSAGCNCVTALYGVTMPSKNADATDEQRYCDAQGVGGQYCPEFDFLEGNFYGIHTTAHSCEAPDADGVYTDCNQPGECTVDPYYLESNDDYYGVGKTIDPTYPLTMRLEFTEDESTGEFSEYTTTLIQGANEVALPSGTTCEGLPKMTDDMTKMVLVISNWGTSANWLQHGTCDSTIDCPTDDYAASISNIKITTKAGMP